MTFDDEVASRIASYRFSHDLNAASQAFTLESVKSKYSYNFSWLGRPIIQYPQDIVGLQEVIWRVKPDLIVETGIAHGGSLILSASMLALLDMADAIVGGTEMNPSLSKRKVLGVDIDIRTHNKVEIERHPFASRIEMIEGSSISEGVVAKVKGIAKAYDRVLVCLDSNHTYDHVLSELKAYASLASVGSYCIVFDTIIEHLPGEMFPDRPWGPGNNPMTAVNEFLANNPAFQVDESMDNKLQVSMAPRGYLKRVR